MTHHSTTPVRDGIDHDGRRRPVQVLSSAAQPLATAYDVLMLDLDGVVYRGDEALDHVASSLAGAHDAGTRLAYVTNNAARTPQDVVAKLRAMGMPAADGDVVTSAQAAARLVARRVPAGARVLVVGGQGLHVALADQGLAPVVSADEAQAVVQGFDPGLRWQLLAEGSYAVARGIPWIASNTDATIPTARGIAPGNGTLVGVVAQTTGRRPEVAGKPYPPLFDETVLRVGGKRPLVVGDRLDTDIEGANNVGADSLLVMTGVSELATVVAAAPAQRPTFVAPDLRSLAFPQHEVVLGEAEARCGEQTVRTSDGALQAGGSGVEDVESAVDLLRATVALAWQWSDADPGRDGALDLSAVRARLAPWGVR